MEEKSKNNNNYLNKEKEAVVFTDKDTQKQYAIILSNYEKEEFGQTVNKKCFRFYEIKEGEKNKIINKKNSEKSPLSYFNFSSDVIEKECINYKEEYDKFLEFKPSRLHLTLIFQEIAEKAKEKGLKETILIFENKKELELPKKGFVSKLNLKRTQEKDNTFLTKNNHNQSTTI
ncbi:MAG TPA: hypothetical protein VLL98_06040 [Rickettsiales bacterium]|nr:hypothetical protein [Rickettsiales bacterium]